MTLHLGFPGLVGAPQPPWPSAKITTAKLSRPFGIAPPTSLLRHALPPSVPNRPAHLHKACLSGQDRVVISPPFLKTCLARLYSPKYTCPCSYIFYYVSALPVGGAGDVRVCLLHCCGLGPQHFLKAGIRGSEPHSTTNSWSFWRFNQGCSGK